MVIISNKELNVAAMLIPWSRSGLISRILNYNTFWVALQRENMSTYFLTQKSK
jgi:hypothetical protein